MQSHTFFPFPTCCQPHRRSRERFRGRSRTLRLGSAVLAATAFINSVGVGQVTVTAPAKTAGPGYTNSTGMVTIKVTIKMTAPLPASGICPVAVAPAGAPTFNMDFYEADWPDPHDCIGVDTTEVGVVAPAVAVAGLGWAITAGPNLVGNTCTVEYTYTYTVTSFCHGNVLGCFDNPKRCGDWLSANDPYINVRLVPGTTAAPAGWTIVGGVAGIAGGADIAVPGLPQVGLADLGVEGPSKIANSDLLQGLPIAALSRGHDEISRLGPGGGVGGAALFIAADPATQEFPMASGPSASLVMVIDSLSQLWAEHAHGGVTRPGSGFSLEPVRYLNVNTAGPGALADDGHIFYVIEGRSQILHAVAPDVTATTLYLDLDTPAPVTALAIEDRGIRGQFDAGDSVLYALEGSSAIHLHRFGEAPTFLTANGYTFDGQTLLSLEGLADRPGVVAPSFTLGHVTALSIASANGNQSIPRDRVSRDFREFDAAAFDPDWAACLADIDGDGVVGREDLLLLLASIGQPTMIDADLDRNASIDSGDLGMLLSAWGTCP